LADDLRRFLGNWPVKARPVGVIGGAWRLMRRKPVVTALLACVVALTAGLVKVSLDLNKALATVPVARYDVSTGRRLPAVMNRVDPSTQPGADADYYRYLELAQRAAQGHFAGPGDALRHLDRCPARLRQWEWFALWQQVRGNEPWRWPQPAVPASGLAFSPNGRYLAALGGDNKDPSSVITVWDSTGEERFRGNPHRVELSALAWGLNSTSLLALDRTGDLYEMELRGADNPTGRMMAVCPPPTRLAIEHQAAVLAAHAANDRVCCVCDGQRVCYTRSSTGIPVEMPVGEPVEALACCPESNWLATGNRHGVIQLWSLATGTRVATLQGHTGSVTALAFSRNGKRLVSSARDGKLCVWEPASRKEVLRFDGPADGASALAFHPDGLHLAVANKRDIALWGDGPP
jgi:hypothetical protein